MSFNDKHKQLFLRRKHKLYRSLAQTPPETERDAVISHKEVIGLYEMVVNKENQATQIGYFIKHELQSDLTMYASAIMGMLWELLDLRSGTFIAFVRVR